MNEDLKAFFNQAAQLAERIASARSVAVVSHIDADGVSSAAIAVQSLKRLEKPYSLHFVKSLGEAELNTISMYREDLIWICDLGTSSYRILTPKNYIITDHHQYVLDDESKMDQYIFLDSLLNPIMFGLNGSTYLSGAGATYFVARELDELNKKLSYLAIVGAVGDMQDRSNNQLIGPLHDIVLKDAVGIVEIVTNDLPFFGWVTRSSAAMLAFSNELKTLGYRDSIKEVSSLFYQSKVPLKRSVPLASKKGKNDDWRSWSELTLDERAIMRVTLRSRLQSLGLDYQALDKMLGDVYILPDNPIGSPTREAKEFATLLNSSGRYILTQDGKGDEERGELIVNVCLNPTIYSESALQNVENHKANIREGVETIGRVVGLTNIQYAKSKNNSYTLKVNDAILGIIAGMVLDRNNKESGLVIDLSKPIVAFAERMDSAPDSGKDPEVKVSARMHRELLKKGINLGTAINKIAIEVNGVGGGHDVAAGATIPLKKIKIFLEALDKEIGEQKARFSP